MPRNSLESPTQMIFFMELMVLEVCEPNAKISKVANEA